MVAAHDEVGAAVVLPHDRVEDGLLRARVAHGRRQDPEEHPIAREVVVDQGLIAVHPHLGGDVIGLGVAHDGVDHQPVAHLKGALLKILMGTVDGVPCLEGHDPLPPALTEGGARLPRVGPVGLEGRAVAAAEHRDGAANQGVALGVDPRHARMGGVGSAVDLSRLTLSITPEHVGHVDGGEDVARVVDDGRLPACLDLGLAEVASDGHRPGQALGEPPGLHDGLVVRLAHEARQGAECAHADHLDVASDDRIRHDARQPRGLGEQGLDLVRRRQPVHQEAPVGGDGAE